MPTKKSKKIDAMEQLLKDYGGLSFTSDPMTVTYHSWTLFPVNDLRIDFSMERRVDNHGQPHYSWSHKPFRLPIGYSEQELYVACVQALEKEFENE